MQPEYRQCGYDDITNCADWLTLDYLLHLASPQALQTDSDHASLPVEGCQNNHISFDSNLSSLKGLRVLIVDGDVDTIDIFSFVLQKEEAEVFGTTSTVEAIDKATTWYPDVLICDISLPGQDGYALVHELRSLQTNPDKFLYAIAVTTLLRQQDCLKLSSQNFRADSFQKYLSKPTDVYELVAVVAELARPQTQINGANNGLDPRTIHPLA
ncbi:MULTISPECIES: response regulator [Cyanophyceae]|uniref:response regulator n=1 Tax=Cyanophyceae TaxID=3028117 RepID=UPI001684E80E|nr:MULTISPECIES: response regulator [Cyanophyceae]MBD1915115.1 response regulator [Phormidium sp. FACHB-77]MBD2032001.1 response regulator [Phormidium sp. FACHB-322]MBD2050475.1 response regulator [Leptolyngbya sp. FACHB-60]